MKKLSWLFELQGIKSLLYLYSVEKHNLQI